ncbi:MAG: polyprenyl synthetase family protein [Actinomycetes bacterium]
MPIAAVESAISSALDAARAAVSPVSGAAAEILEPLATIATGGKRLRARLLVAAHDACGGGAREAAIGAAAATELFQTAALVHDDVLDQADTRRGGSTIHRSLAAQHEEAGWSGAAEHFGVSAAILAGDIALMASHLALARAASALAPERGLAVSELFATMSQLCTAGQYADMRLAAQPIDALADQEEHILAMMRSKTASYTAEFPLALGAACAGADDDVVAGLRDAGVPLGIAFQLRDDILGLVGSPDITGKPAGDDVREGKRTLLMVHAWRAGDDAARRAIGAAFARPEASDAEVAAAVEAIRDTGAVDEVERRIAAYADQARAALEAVGERLRDEGALSELHALLAVTTQRAA